ncbi:MAG: glycerophosphodiester phosphodiesterase [Polyangiales bacterium]
MLIVFCLGLGCAERGPTPGELLESNTFLNIAHRGGRGRAPEHTMVAYEKALVEGADVLELDIHSTSDGVLIVSHDATIDRTTDGTGCINDMTYAELSAFDAGYRFTDDSGETFPYRGMGITVPKLEEVLDAFPDVPFVIEIKQPSVNECTEAPSIVEPFVDMLRHKEMIDQVIGAGFSDPVVQQLRAYAPEMKTSLATGEVIEFAFLEAESEASYVPPGRFLQVPTNFLGIDVLTEDFLARARRFDMKVQVWTINNVEEMQQLIDLGVDAIMTDYPNRLSELL